MGSFVVVSPKTMFIMGGGEGSAAREALRHNSIEEVVMCDIDQVNNPSVPGSNDMGNKWCSCDAIGLNFVAS